MFCRSLLVCRASESLGSSQHLLSSLPALKRRKSGFCARNTSKLIYLFMFSGSIGTGGKMHAENKRRRPSLEKGEALLGRLRAGFDRTSPNNASQSDVYNVAKYHKKEIGVKIEDRGIIASSDATGMDIYHEGYLPLMRPSRSDDPGVPAYVQVDEYELTLEYTMNIGQSFRWRSIDPDRDSVYVGVLGNHVLALKHDTGPLGVSHVWYKVLSPRSLDQSINPSENIGEQLDDYFNLGHVHLSALSKDWAARDVLYREIVQDIPGARMLRQDPVECLFSFICSQNNHISRIHGMVNRLAQMYGSKIDVDEDAPEIVRYKELYGDDSAFYSFPDIEKLQDAREEDLRNAGFGYRAKFIEATARMLKDMPGGGKPWLMRLRDTTFEESIEELCVLPGVGPKVAACVALFSLDKHSSIPVDTHVWQLSLRHYTPHLKGKTNAPKYHPEIQAAFVKVFGDYAGWAHNTLFISELSSIQKKLFDRRQKVEQGVENHTPQKHETK